MLIQDTKRLLRKIFGVDAPMPPQAKPKADPGAVGGDVGGHRDYMTSWEWLQMNTDVKTDRLEKYQEYTKMDDEDGDLPAGVLNSYRDDACQRDLHKRKMVWPEGDNKEISSIIEKLFVGPLAIESELPRVIREMCKMGDNFEQLMKGDRQGVLGWKHRLPDVMYRIEDDFGRLKGFTVGGEEGDPSLPWDFCHFRLGSKSRGDIYGSSVLESSRRRWYELRMAEQAALLFRIKMAPDRDIYYIDCGSQSSDQQRRTVERWRKSIKKKTLVDPRLLKYEVEFDPRNTDDDLFWPVTVGKNSRIERLSGTGKMADMEDLRYWLTRYLSTVNIPPGYFGLLETGGALNLNTSLAAQDIRYARKVKAIQRDTLDGLMRICFIHLALLGFDPFLPANKFDLVMTPVSFLDEFHRQELVNIRMDIAGRLLDLGDRGQFTPKPWLTYVLQEFARIPPDILLQVMPENLGEEATPAGDGVTGFEGLTVKDRQVIQEVFRGHPALLSKLGVLTRDYYRWREGDPILESSQFSLGYSRENILKMDELVKKCRKGAA